MRLREGTGAVFGFGLIGEAVKIYSKMATLQSAGISDRGQT
jgi:NaMN:DMB phosphoribosyltransferase